MARGVKPLTNYQNLEGQIIGRWRVIELATYIPNTGVRWTCVCECGTKKSILGTSLTSGRSQSCGCYATEKKRKPRLDKESATIGKLFATYKSQAKQRGLEFHLTKREAAILFFGKCVYCGIQPRQSLNIKLLAHNGIDRVDNTEGYTTNNCVACCEQCSYAKRNQSLPDFQAWLDRIIEYARSIHELHCK